MDYRNDNRTPRDRVDDEFFRSLLREEDEADEPRNTRGREHSSGTRMTNASVHENRSNDSRMSGRNSRMNSSCMNDSCSRNSRMNESYSRNSRMNDRMQRSCQQDGCERSSRMQNDCCTKNCPTSTWGNDCLSDYPLGMVYIPSQSFRNLMETTDALHAGTIFFELDLPFHHAGCKGGSCR